MVFPWIFVQAEWRLAQQAPHEKRRQTMVAAATHKQASRRLERFHGYNITAGGACPCQRTCVCVCVCVGLREGTRTLGAYVSSLAFGNNTRCGEGESIYCLI